MRGESGYNYSGFLKGNEEFLPYEYSGGVAIEKIDSLEEEKKMTDVSDALKISEIKKDLEGVSKKAEVLDSDEEAIEVLDLKNSIKIDGINVTFGRPIEEVIDKWKSKKEIFGVRTFGLPRGNRLRFVDFLNSGDPIRMGVNKKGQLKIYEGNTRFFGANKMNIEASLIPVICTLPNQDIYEGSFSGLLKNLKK